MVMKFGTQAEEILAILTEPRHGQPPSLLKDNNVLDAIRVLTASVEVRGIIGIFFFQWRAMRFLTITCFDRI